MPTGNITAVTPIKHGADRGHLTIMVSSLSDNSRVTTWAAAAHPDDAPFVVALAEHYGLDLLLLEEWGTNVARLRNKLLALVPTAYFLQADADDLYRPGTLDELANRLDRNEFAGGIFGLCTDFDSDTGYEGLATPPVWLELPGWEAKPGDLAKQRAFIAQDHSPFPVAPYGPHPGAGLFTTETFGITGGYPEYDGGNFWDDVEHLGRVNLHFPVLTAPDVDVLRYRRHSGSVTVQLADPDKWASVAARLDALEAPLKTTENKEQ